MEVPELTLANPDTRNIADPTYDLDINPIDYALPTFYHVNGQPLWVNFRTADHENPISPTLPEPVVDSMPHTCHTLYTQFTANYAELV